MIFHLKIHIPGEHRDRLPETRQGGGDCGYVILVIVLQAAQLASWINPARGS